MRQLNDVNLHRMVTGADPASQSDPRTIRLLKDHHLFFPFKCQGALQCFMNLAGNLVLMSPLMGILVR